MDRKIPIIEKDIFESGAAYICHQVNCQGEMNSGVAKQVKEKYVKAYQFYMIRCKAETEKEQLLGENLYVEISSELTIVNMFAQNDFGYDDSLYTNYKAFERCLCHIATQIPLDKEIAFPYLIGCGLGGGDWKIISSLIEDILVNHNVVYYKHEN